MFHLFVQAIVAAAVVWGGVYNKAEWPTKAECEAFVASDAGKLSLEGLKEAMVLNFGKDVEMKITCATEPPPSE